MLFYILNSLSYLLIKEFEKKKKNSDQFLCYQLIGIEFI